MLVPGADKPWLLAPGGLVVLVLVALGFGHQDASWGYRVARGQRLHFGIIAVVTAAVFAVLYLAGYTAGKRWPLRRKDSLKYRALPRHQRRGS